MTECKTCGIPGHKLQCPERDGGQLKFTATSATDECKACGIDGEYVALREAMLQKSVEHWRKTAEGNKALLRQALELAADLSLDILWGNDEVGVCSVHHGIDIHETERYGNDRYAAACRAITRAAATIGKARNAQDS